MKPNIASLINALLLISLSIWGYLSSETPSITALIPAFIGIVLLICNPGIKKENKIIAHIAVVLTLLVLIGLVKPLIGAIERQNSIAIGRVSIMLVSTIVALITFVRSFIEARRT